MGSHQKPGRDTLYESIVKKIMETDGKLPSFNQVDFTLEERSRMEKLSFMDDLVRKKLPVLKRSDVYKLFSMKYPDTSQRQFYRYYDEMQQLFGSTSLNEKEYQKSVYIEYLHQIIGLAFRTKDLKTAVNAIKEASLLQDLYSKEDAERKLKDPTTFLLAINFNLPSGEKEQRIIDLDQLNKLNKGDFNQVLDEIQNIEFPIENMKLELDRDTRDEGSEST